ncbi:hypothetical protein Taro_046308 [Colocasia esculenta]|uniref:Uncharacterized protein n=1 Tax=Colocasia esculenta TaxID=4460 RepID=A0A843WPI4_COLES|nr:hypothetical protein [Colocasia esculenta]
MNDVATSLGQLFSLTKEEQPTAINVSTEAVQGTKATPAVARCSRRHNFPTTWGSNATFDTSRSTYSSPSLKPSYSKFSELDFTFQQFFSSNPMWRTTFTLPVTLPSV